MGVLWDFMGVCGVLWEFYGSFMGVYGVFYGILWVFDVIWWDLQRFSGKIKHDKGNMIAITTSQPIKMEVSPRNEEIKAWGFTLGPTDVSPG